MDVMRARSTVTDPRMSSFAEPVIEKGSALRLHSEVRERFLPGARQSEIEEVPLSKTFSEAPMEILDELSDAMPKTPENRSSQQLPILPTLDFGSLVSKLLMHRRCLDH